MTIQHPPPPPPPAPDTDINVELCEGFGPRMVAFVVVLMVALVVIVGWMVHLGCDPLRCP